MNDLFKDKAGDWDKADMRTQLSRTIAGAMLSQVGFTDDMTVLDFGAGTGLVAGPISQSVAKIVAVDISQAMLDQLAAKQDLHGKVEPVRRDILAEPFDTPFDAIISAMAMHHVEDTAALVRSFAAHVKPGAPIALADLDREDGSFHPPGTEGVYHAGFDRDALAALLVDAGFTDVSFVTAHTVERETRSYPVFLVTAVRGSSPSSASVSP